ALAKATSHQQSKVKKPKLKHRVAKKLKISPKLVSDGSFALAFLLLGGFFAYQNIPGLTMRLAASRSGVQGSLPTYQPSGFSLGKNIAYKPGQITINYYSNSDDRSYTVTQSKSSWNSQALHEHFVKD